MGRTDDLGVQWIFAKRAKHYQSVKQPQEHAMTLQLTSYRNWGGKQVGRHLPQIPPPKLAREKVDIGQNDFVSPKSFTESA